MQTKSSIILKSDEELAKELKNLKKFLVQTKKLSFWKTYFSKKKFFYDGAEVTWEYWEKIPFITKADFLDIGIEKRLKDARKIIKNEYIRFLFQTTSGTSKLTKPVLYIKTVDYLTEGEEHDKGKRTIFFLHPYHIALRDTLAHIRRSKREKNSVQSLVVNPFKANKQMLVALEEFRADSILTFPAAMGYIVSVAPGIARSFSLLKKIWLVGDFLTPKQALVLSSQFKNVYVDVDYVTVDVDSIGVCCKFLQKKYGMNAYHPNPDRIIELINRDENGVGEVVVTKTRPLELAFIRFKIGDIARAEKQVCPCGNTWIFFMEGRKDMDYIRGLGVLVTRAEIERVLKPFQTIIEEWRGEVREVTYKKMLLGELTILIKPKNKNGVKKEQVSMIKDGVSMHLFLTPKKTLSKLVTEEKFMPLKINVVEDFPITTKKVLLRKIMD